MAREVSVCIEVDQHPRVLFKILEKANSGLTIILRHGEGIRSYDAPTELGPRTSVQRLSIHTSNPESHGNLIHQTLKTEFGLLENHFWTKAVKQKQGFSLLFSKLSPTLDNERYKLKQN